MTVKKKTVAEIVNILDPLVVQSIEEVMKTSLVKDPVNEIEHIHVCLPQEKFKPNSYEGVRDALKIGPKAFLFHLYDNYDVDNHPNRLKRNIIVWLDGKPSLKILPLFEWDLYDEKERITIYSEDLGLIEPVYVEIVKEAVKRDFQKTYKNFLIVKKERYDLVYSFEDSYL